MSNIKYQILNVKYHQPLPHCCPLPLFPSCVGSQLSHTMGCCTAGCTSPINGKPSYMYALNQDSDSGVKASIINV